MFKSRIHHLPWSTTALGESFEVPAGFRLITLKNQLRQQAGNFHIARNPDRTLKVTRLSGAASPRSSMSLSFSTMEIGDSIILPEDHPLYDNATVRAARTAHTFSRHIEFETGTMTFTRTS